MRIVKLVSIIISCKIKMVYLMLNAYLRTAWLYYKSGGHDNMFPTLNEFFKKLNNRS